MLPPVAEFAHALSPRPITAGLQIGTHNGLHLIRRYAVLLRNHRETDMIRQRHLYNFADVVGILAIAVRYRRHIIYYRFFGRFAAR